MTGREAKWSKTKRKAHSKALQRAWQALSEDEKQRRREKGKAQAVYGIEGGAPPKYPPCSLRLNNKKLRHRFYGGVCKCGIVNLPNFYRFEGDGEDRVWYQREGTGWKRI